MNSIYSVQKIFLYGSCEKTAANGDAEGAIQTNNYNNNYYDLKIFKQSVIFRVDHSI